MQNNIFHSSSASIFYMYCKLVILIILIFSLACSKTDDKEWTTIDTSNKNPISFYNYEIPLIINLMFEKLTTDHKIISKVVNNFMNLVKKQFNIEILEKFLLNKENQKKTVLFNFAKSIKLYCLNLDKIIENSKI